MRRLRRVLFLVVVAVLFLVLSWVASLFGPGPGRGGERSPPPPAAPPAGRVVSARGDAPAPGTRVAAVGPGGRTSARVDPDGTFRFDPGTEPGPELEVVSGSLRVRVARGPSPQQIRLPDRLTVAGRVVGGATEEAVAGARVSCGDRSVATGPRGSFRLEDVPVPGGRLAPVRVEADGYEPLVLETGTPRPWEDLFLRLVRR